MLSLHILKWMSNIDFVGMLSDEIFIFNMNSSYEGCLLYFGIREQKQILIIINRFIVFQIIPH